ncbi:MAG TPA: hypothetical protein VLJ58_09595 [Ramlibacter sp.]|nr:hypothetical protein [Ramlibacter sp.]
MKRLFLAAALGLAGLVLGSAQAAVTATGTFDVNITLTPKCEINTTNTATGAAVSHLNLSYTSFQLADTTGSTNFGVRCTTSLPYSVSISNPTQLDSVLALNYTLNLTNSATYASGSTGSIASQTGTGLTAQTYYVHATIASGQSGTCAGPGGTTCSNSAAADKTHTVTVTY